MANPATGMAGAAYGYADMGPYAGGQAELLRVPWADFNCPVLTDQILAKASRQTTSDTQH